MDRSRILDIEAACTRLINQFAVYNDAGRFHDLVELFVEGGRYARPIAPDVCIVGKPEILASFEARPQERVGRHLITNVLIEVHDERSASGFCYVTLYSGNSNHKAERFGLQAEAVQYIGEYRDSFVLTDTGWKFSERQGCIIFTA